VITWRSRVAAAARVVGQNPSASVFLVGLVAFVAGVAQWSGPWAAVTGGAILMTVAAWPFLQTPKGPA
jgi:hypothetical protein